MSAPWWVRWTVATIMVVIAGYHLARLVLAHRRRRRLELDVDLTHASMGPVMAIMSVSRLPAVSSRTWALGFALAGLWFAGGSPAGPLAPTLTATCQLAMSATTAYMLVLLLS